MAVVLGTRPEIIKLAPLIQIIGDAARVIHTGQHYDVGLSDVFFEAFGIDTPVETIGVGGATRGHQIGAAISALENEFTSRRPDAVVVQGDTNSTMAAAIAANASGIPLVHVEAGLRSFDRAMPEEHNRVVTDQLSDLCLAPTAVSASNLRAEGISGDRIVVTGNTVVEAVERLMPDAEERARLLSAYGLEPESFVLSTFHRPENVDDRAVFEVILNELADLDLPVVIPIHPRSRAQATEFGLDGLLDRLQVIDPIGYPDFLGLLRESALAVADSGGVQEEVSVVKRPMVVVRNSTERPEVLGTFATLVKPGPDIGSAVREWMDDYAATVQRMTVTASPYGDGSAGERSAEALRDLIAG